MTDNDSAARSPGPAHRRETPNINESPRTMIFPESVSRATTSPSATHPNFTTSCNAEPLEADFLRTARLLEEWCAVTVDAVELVVTALMAGAAAGVKDTATTAVKDSYASLQNAVRRLLIRGSEADVALLETPVEHRPELVTALTAAGAADDHDVLIAAQTLLAQLGQAGKYDIQINDSQGIQVGDGNTMHLRF